MKPFFNFNKVVEELRSACIIQALVLIALGWGLVGSASATIIINAPMTDTNSTGWTLGGNPTSALLTGNGVIDPVGNGWLRLTNNGGNQTGYAYNTTTFDLSGGLLIEFDYATWGGNGADGYSVFLFDAGVSPFNIGAFGGSLGYAQKGASFSGGACTAAGNVPGISGGYIGVGVDEYGNFADCGEGRYLSLNNNSNVVANTVTIRGPVVGFGGGAVGQTQNTTSYPWIATSANNGALWFNGARPSQTGANYRKVRIQITPAPNPVASVWVVFGYASPLVYTPMITNRALPAISTSQLLMMGYAASTGGANNYHEIRNLLVSNQATTSAIDLAITKSFTDVTSGSTTTASAGDQVRYTVVASNTGPNNVTATGVGIQDTVPAAITGVNWTCAGSGGATCGAASGSGNTINTTANLPLNGYVTYTITGTLSAPAPSQLTNTASLVIPGAITDYNSNNNSVTLITPVNSDLSTSTKTWTDLNGGDQNPGDVIPYTITLNETAGAAASGVSVTDTFPATLTGLSVTSCPAGATCNIVGQTLTVSNISVPANGSVVIVVSTTIAGGTAVGTLINNTATVTNPGGVGDTPAAPTITVSASAIAATGNKALYFYGTAGGTPGPISRSTIGNTTNVTIGNPAVVSWTQDIPMQLPMTLNPTTGGNVSVNLWLSNTTNARTRTVTVTLSCGAISLTQTPTITLNIAPSLITFNFPYAGTQTCASGNSWVFTLNNNNFNRVLTAYPVNGSPSYINLPSANVISVTSVTAYNQAYPGVGTLASWTTSTVYLRAVVSDPFGNADITGTTITIKDPTGTTIVPPSGPPPAMTEQVPARTASTKTFEYAFMPTAPAASGFWTASVTAQEGLAAENPVPPTDTSVGTFKITPSLSVLKSAQTYSDPVNKTTNPKAIPGAEMLYTVQVTNSSYGSVDANSTQITDPIPANTSMCVSTTCSNPIMTFTCSASPACGLTFSYPANVTYTCASPPAPCPQADANGYGANVTSIAINPSGTLYGAPSPQSTNFSVQFKVKIN